MHQTLERTSSFILNYKNVKLLMETRGDGQRNARNKGDEGIFWSRDN